MGAIIGITGTPGTGKKSTAPLVARALGMRSMVLPPPSRVHPISGPLHVIEIDTAEAKKEISRNPPGRVLAYGHLLPYVLPARLVEKVVVLRCDPKVLKARLATRGYSEAKARENVEAELIGLISSDSFRAFGLGKTFELDTTSSTPQAASDAILSIIRGASPGRRQYDWLLSYRSSPDLNSLFPPGPES